MSQTKEKVKILKNLLKEISRDDYKQKKRLEELENKLNKDWD